MVGRQGIFDKKQTEKISMIHREKNGFFGPIKTIGKRRIKLWLNTGM
jgi:hypothetical protein